MWLIGVLLFAFLAYSILQARRVKMPRGIYKPIKSRWLEFVNPVWFTNNLQVLLAVIAFALFIALELWGPVTSVEKPSLLNWIVIAGGTLVFSISAFIGIVAFILLLWLMKNLVFGYEIEYDPETTDPKILRAIIPIKSKSNSDKARNVKQP